MGGRRKRDVYLWAGIVARGPSVKFEVENIHTMAELKMTGNCLAASRPLLSFSEDFSSTGEPHWQIVKELLTGMLECRTTILSLSLSLTTSSPSPWLMARSGSETTRSWKRMAAWLRLARGWF